MKNSLLSAVCALYLVFSSSINAAPVGYNFIQNGYDEGAFVTGMFWGDDLNNDGQLSWFQGEVTDFMMDFSGSSLVGSFSLNFSQLFGLVYDLDGGPLGDGITIDVEGIGANSGLYSYGTGQGATGTDGGTVFDQNSGLTSVSPELVQVSLKAVPIPAAVWLFGSGLLGLVGVSRRKKA